MQALGQQFVEVLIAPSFTGEALVQQLQTKANVRVLQIALPPGGQQRLGAMATTCWMSSVWVRVC